jgi:hypothetical protein
MAKRTPGTANYYNEQNSAMPKQRMKPPSYANPGRCPGSFQFGNVRARTPTSILIGGKQSRGAPRGGYGDVDDGDGTGVDTTYKRGF